MKLLNMGLISDNEWINFVEVFFGLVKEIPSPLAEDPRPQELFKTKKSCLCFRNTHVKASGQGLLQKHFAPMKPMEGMGLHQRDCSNEASETSLSVFKLLRRST